MQVVIAIPELEREQFFERLLPGLHYQIRSRSIYCGP